ncbi:MAG: peroxiredoxin, partial [Nitrososphaeria archaeon]|nr:peroxiredoxin [Nitrososphaeria archaeon]
MLNIGSRLPEIKALNQNGEEIDFKNFIGKVTVIYFYPRDFTPGCTKEACSFRDNLSKFGNANIVGVSVQDVNSHKKFYLEYNLNF